VPETADQITEIKSAKPWRLWKPEERSAATISDLRLLISDLWQSRKEVIQPQVPLRLPCYDFTPVADLTVVGCLPRLPQGWPAALRSNQLPWCDGRCVQGPGTYSPRRADPRLLAIPTSCSRVAENNPN
jgi:hypothetical protein